MARSTMSASMKNCSPVSTSLPPSSFVTAKRMPRSTPPAASTPPASPQATPPAEPPKTVAQTPPPAEEPKTPAPADWPEDWRQKLAKDDKRLLARLERMSSPLDVLNAWRGIEQRMSSGELKRTLPHNPTEDEIKAYRESNGIPEKPEDYDVNLGNGFNWGENDKELLDGFRKVAHDANIPNDMLKPILGWYAQQQQQILEAEAQRDENQRANGTDALRAQWGADFQKNMNAMRNLFDAHSVESVDGSKQHPAFDLIMGARAQDGRKLGNIPGVLAMFSNLSRELNPFATLVPDSGGAAPMKTAETRLAEFTGMMRDRTGPYWRGPNAGNLQQEWRELTEAVQRQKERAA